jgi:hypothetical protein
MLQLEFSKEMTYRSFLHRSWMKGNESTPQFQSTAYRTKPYKKHKQNHIWHVADRTHIHDY